MKRVLFIIIMLFIIPIVSKADTLFTINGTPYSSFSNLGNACDADGVIMLKIAKDITNYVNLYGNETNCDNITIDLQGHTIEKLGFYNQGTPGSTPSGIVKIFRVIDTSSSPGTVNNLDVGNMLTVADQSVFSRAYVVGVNIKSITIYRDGNLTINNGTLYHDNPNYKPTSNDIKNYGILTINSGTYTGTTFENYKTMTINDGTYNSIFFSNTAYGDGNNTSQTKVSLNINGGTFNAPSKDSGFYMIDNSGAPNPLNCELRINGGTFNMKDIVTISSVSATNYLSGTTKINTNQYFFDAANGDTYITGGEYTTTNTSHNMIFQAYGNLYFSGGTINALNGDSFVVAGNFIFGTGNDPATSNPVFNAPNVTIGNTQTINWSSGYMNVKDFNSTRTTIPNNYHIKKQQQTNYYKVYLEADNSRGDWNNDKTLDGKDLAWYRKYIAGSSEALTTYNNHQNKTVLDTNGDNKIDLVDLLSCRLQIAKG